MAYDLTAELFSELAVGVVIFGIRFYARWKMVGFGDFGYDDVFAGAAVVFWILEATFLYTCGAIGNNIGLNEETALAVPDADVPRLVEGSKHAYVAWVFYILTIWTLKGVLLLLYNRLTMGLWQHKLARFMLFVSGVTFLASLFWHIFSCFPTQKAWQIKPFPGENCTLRRGNYIIITILDVITDLGIIAIPLPMLLMTRLALRQKLSLGILFSSGVFVIAASIARAYYSLVNIGSLPVALGWASREILVASIVVCAPSIKPLVTELRIKYFGRTRTGTASGSWTTRDSNALSQLHKSKGDIENITTITSGRQKPTHPHKMSTMGHSHHASESQDYINTVSDADSKSLESDTAPERESRRNNGIIVTTEVNVSR